MAFAEINGDQKQSINLSEEAWIVIEQDMAAFGSKSKSGFFNRVILNFYEDADATLSRTWQRKFEEFYGDFTELPDDADAQGKFRASLKKLTMDQRKTAAEVLADNAVQRLKETVIDKYPRGTGEKFRINNELFSYLTQSSECREDKAYEGYIGRYLKAILEEYARLPYYKRERIYYAPRFRDIQNAIDAKKRLRLMTADHQECVVKPYRILTDNQTKYHYLVAWCDQTGEESPDGPGKAHPFRISNILQIKQLNRSGKITEREKAFIEEALQHKDVPFMGEDICTVRVALTKAGISKYGRILNMRPQYKAIEGPQKNIFVFETTLRQAQYYFERFGPDARILEPAALAQQMQQWHQKAAVQYE